MEEEGFRVTIVHTINYNFEVGGGERREKRKEESADFLCLLLILPGSSTDELLLFIGGVWGICLWPGFVFLVVFFLYMVVDRVIPCYLS